LAIAVSLVVLIVGGAVTLVREICFAPRTITAYFTSATAIYPGDEVRVAGVKVGDITAITPDGDRVNMTLQVNRDVPIPADAKAVIVAANLISARYVELTPAYRSTDPDTSGPTMANGAVIPIDRTAVPVEWDQVKAQLMRLATELGPHSKVSNPAIARFINSAAGALDGNGDKLRQTLAQLSSVGRVLAQGSGNIAGTIKNLRTLVGALRDISTQIVEFQGRFATLTSVLSDNRSDLDTALKTLSSAIGDVHGFLVDTRDKTSEQVQRLADVTSNLVDHRKDLEQLLHVAGTAIANGYADYDADSGTILGSVSFNNFSNPVQFICGAIGAVKNTTAPETAKLCAQYLGPALEQMNFNNVPFPINPILAPASTNVIYTEPALAPGGEGPKAGPAQESPAVSAYTGFHGDVGPPSLGNLLLPDPPSNPADTPPTPEGVTAPVIGRRLAHMVVTVNTATVLTLTGCSFHGVNSLPLPGAQGTGSGDSTYHVEIANVATLESNSPVMINDVVVGSVGPMTLQGQHADVEVRVKAGTVVPANAVATIGQTSLLGSMHLQLSPPPGQPAVGRIAPGSTIGLNKSSTYPSTEQTLSSLSAMVNAGGLGQIGDIVHNFNAALSGHQDAVRDLITRLDTFVGVLDRQRGDMIATITQFNRFAAILNGQHDVIVQTLRSLPAALAVLVAEEPRIVTALKKLGTFSDTATALVGDVQDDLVKNLKDLEPTIRALADVGPAIDDGLTFATVFPYGQNIIDRGLKGDYLNLFAVADITVPRLKKTAFLGTRWGVPGAELVPAPGDPGYDWYYTKNPMGVLTAIPPTGSEVPPPAPPAGPPLMLPGGVHPSIPTPTPTAPAEGSVR